jgi:hypothetical protein
MLLTKELAYRIDALAYSTNNTLIERDYIQYIYCFLAVGELAIIWFWTTVVGTLRS